MEQDKIDPFEISRHSDCIVVEFCAQGAGSVEVSSGSWTVLIMICAEWNKKRKLQGEQLGMPSPKHKFRDRCCGAEIKSPTTDDKEVEDNIHDCPIEDATNGGAGDRSEGCESVKDSNSFIEESDTATMPVDSEDKPNAEIGTNYLDWLSISSSSSSIKNYRSNRNFPASTAIKSGEESTHVCIETNPAILGDDLQSGGGIPSTEDHLDELGMNYYDFIHSEYKNDGNEHSTEIATEEMMLYSNDVPSNLYVLSSGRWSVGPDARLSARKPTIDQEFEQYFSTLML